MNDLVERNSPAEVMNEVVLGQMIRAWMDRYGYSFRRLAAEIEVSPATLHRLIQGKTVSLETAMAVAIWMLGPSLADTER